MPRKPHPKNAYLEMHDGHYRVTMGVPAPLRGMLGNRLKHSLGTKSLISANVLKVPVVKLFKTRIEKAWETIGGRKRSELQEAVSWAKVLGDTGLPGGDAHDHYAEQLRNRVAEIRQKGSRWITDVDEDGEAYEVEVFTDESLKAAEAFSAVAHGSATPIALHHDAYMKTLKIKARSLTDDTRALKILLDWCAAREIKPYLERIDIKIAVRFMDELQDFTGLSWATAAKYLGRLNRYWTYLIKRTDIGVNPFTGLTIDKPKVDPNEEERSFKDIEVQTLLMGKPDPGMMDVMLIAALTGARLDAVIDLRVGECADGWFTFKPQKKEVSARDVPIHPDLRDLVAARAKGKAPDDDFFPDWPAPTTKGSMRERSAYFSKRFTKYRRELGVADVVDGKRRSLVNFHSFRRWFITKGERAAIDGDLLAAIVGHKRSGLTLGRYSEGPEMSAAKMAIAKIKLPPLDGSPITEAQALTPRSRTTKKIM
ncbi:integrase [Methylobacterium sp. WL103]|uniref:integrase n=1 Tax=Methylobacterium sp. WL103 TaxID=2603891 RepID=UPI0011CA0042|nr:integrase [Methylobacterium sp. WL103]TXN07501.1 integrase [Methylobacterium sp. WL103]